MLPLSVLRGAGKRVRCAFTDGEVMPLMSVRRVEEEGADNALISEWVGVDLWLVLWLEDWSKLVDVLYGGFGSFV